MADIFLSYAREDLAKAKLLAEALQQQGWSVFWDRTSLLAGQDFNEVIEQAIEQAQCLIVCWSSTSIKSDWVRGEADIGRERRILIPILLDAAKPPIAFRALHTENFATWTGNSNAAEYLALCKAISQRLAAQPAGGVTDTTTSPPPTRVRELRQTRWNGPVVCKAAKRFGVIAAVVLLIAGIADFFGKNTLDIKIDSLNDKPEATVTTQPVLTPVVPTTAADKTQTPITSKPVQPLIKEPEMVRIPAGSFEMGSNNGADDEKPVHSVNLKSFAIGRYEVTFDEYDRYAEATGEPKPEDSGWGRSSRPVINVSWDQASAYAAWLAQQTGKSYRLPTEAEWEYAARAGTTGDYYWGTGEASNYAWFNENSKDQTHPVGKLNPNAVGLYDMAGNVWEWVRDCYHSDYDGAPTNGSAWQRSNGACGQRVIRGGSWGSLPAYLRSALRGGSSPDNRFNTLGFRLAQD